VLELVDPRPHAVGSIAEAFACFPHIGPVLPALGYSAAQRLDLERTVAASGAEAIVDASPARLDRFLSFSLPVARVRYAFRQLSGPPILDLVVASVERARRTP
jgi:predicted GTPase